MSVLSNPYFHDEAKAFEYLESILWPEGSVCPHCGSMSGKHYDLRKTRLGLRKCSDCRKQFTVKVGTVFESAHIPLNKMLQAVHLTCSSKKGISAHQLHCILEVQYKTAWFLCHRIREAMRSGGLTPIGGEGGHYSRLGADFASHETVNHKADEYVRGEAHTNTVEGYFSIFKRGMKGVYQHCSGETFAPLHR